MKKLVFVCMMIAASCMFYSCGPSEIVVTSRPNPPVYVRPIAPRPAYVWVDGDWHARSGRYYWREGRWVRPGHRVWVTGNWESRGSGWYWRRGHWRR
ncbi:MAG: hypothetical protein WDN26_15760 [Chitinophagaceae bacterium]